MDLVLLGNTSYNSAFIRTCNDLVSLVPQSLPSPFFTQSLHKYHLFCPITENKEGSPGHVEVMPSLALECLCIISI